MPDEIDRKLDSEYITPHLHDGETVRIRISSAASTGWCARLLNALGPMAILVEAFFSRPTFVALTDQRLLFSAVTVLRNEVPVESIELEDLGTVEVKRGPFCESLYVLGADERCFRVTTFTWLSMEQRDNVREFFEALSRDFAPQPA